MITYWKHLNFFAVTILLTCIACSLNAENNLKEQAKDIDPVMLYQQAEDYYRGRDVPQDLQQAAKYYKQAAELNYPQAQNKLAYLYEIGKGIEMDLNAAFHWYHKAAAVGYLTAQYNLAEKYRLGIGVTKDEEQALAWCRRAALSGHKNAMKRLADYYDKGIGGEQDYARALAWYNMAIEVGTLVPLGMKHALQSKMSQTQLFESENRLRDIRKLMSEQ